MSLINSNTCFYLAIIAAILFLLFIVTSLVATVRAIASNSWEASRWIKVYRTRSLASIFLLLAFASLIAYIVVRIVAPIQ